MSWESNFEFWAKPPSQTEQDRMDNARRAVKAAIDTSAALNTRDIEVFTQGSYRNRTSVRQDSDVDICVMCKDTFYFELPKGMTREQFQLNSAATYADATFRTDVESALKLHFGTSSVTSGNKAWDIHKNTYRVDADVVACFEYREYSSNGSIRYGTALLPQSGSYIQNFPKQSYQSGKEKNDETGRRFRANVRILKRLGGVMKDEKVNFTQLPSFLMESLAWNVPNDYFGYDTYTEDVKAILAHLCDETRSHESCEQWCEVNGIKYLFHDSQPWNRIMVNSSLNAMWTYLGF